MSDKVANHQHAAARHEMAADSHERAASFWEAEGDSVRAGLQHEMAEYERHGAQLELRWAETVESDTVQPEVRAAEQVVAQTRQGAKTASSILIQLATTLERTAGLAEEHAHRREQAGRTDDACKERKAAKRARGAAERARSQAEEWLRSLGEQET